MTAPTDEKEKDYRFVYSSITDEVLLIMTQYGIEWAKIFESRLAFHQFIEDGKFNDWLFSDKVIRQADDILREKGGG